MRNKRNLILKQAEEMKPDLICCFYKSKPPPIPLVIPSVFPSISFLSCSLSSAVSQWPNPHGRFDQQFCSKAADICPNGEEAFSFFFFSLRCRHTPPATCQENKHAIAVKRILKGEKNVCMKKTGMWEEGHLRRQSWRNYISQAPLGGGYARLLNLKAI